MFQQTMTIEEHLQDAIDDLRRFGAHLIDHGNEAGQQFTDRADQLEAVYGDYRRHRANANADGLVAAGARAVKHLEGMAAMIRIAASHAND